MTDEMFNLIKKFIVKKKLFCAILTCVCLNASAATDFDKWFGILKQDPVGTTYGVTSKKDGSFVVKTPIKTFEVKKTAKNTYEVLGMTVGVKQHNSYTFTTPLGTWKVNTRKATVEKTEK